MAVINIELPLLLLVVALACAILIWLLGTFTRIFRSHRYRVSLGVFSFCLSGLMGFFSSLKVEGFLFGNWFSIHPIFWLVVVAYCGYLLFGFLGCWTVVRVLAPFDRKRTLSELYSALETRKRSDA